MVHFVDQNSAALAISLYKGSECWGTPGLDMNLRTVNVGGSNSNKRPFSAGMQGAVQLQQPCCNPEHHQVIVPLRHTAAPSSSVFSGGGGGGRGPK